MDSANQSILSFGKNYRQVLNIVGAVLAFIVTIYSLYYMVSLWDYMGYDYFADGLEIAASLCWYLYCFINIVGFGAVGVILLAKPDHIILSVGSGVLALACLFNALQMFFYMLWLSYYASVGVYLIAILSCLLCAVGWALPAVTGFIKNKAAIQKFTLAFLILPVAIFLFSLLASLVSGYFTASQFFIPLLEAALMVIVGLCALCNDGIPAEPRVTQPRPGVTARPGETAKAAPTAAVNGEKDYSLSIVLLIVLSIVTFGIYVFIWIYRVSEFLGKTLGREQFSPGVEVVLCLFVPFYIIYWVYKQSKGIDEAHRMRGNFNNTDLSVISLLLTIFSLGIVAYALMQDQINKLCSGYTAPAYGAAPNGNYGQPMNNGYNQNGQPMNNGYTQPTQPMNNGYTQPTQPINNGYTQPGQPMNNGGVPHRDAAGYEEIRTEAEPPAETKNPGAQAESLRMLEDLLNKGILTQEEFDAKKKQILGL